MILNFKRFKSPKQSLDLPYNGDFCQNAFCENVTCIFVWASFLVLNVRLSLNDPASGRLNR